MIKGAIFDMDGLMFDTERLGLEGWKRAASALGYPITPEIISQIRGANKAYSKALFFRTFGEKVDFEKARAVRTAYVNEYINKNGMPIKKGLVKLLTYLKEQEFKIAVATSTHQELAEQYLKAAGVYPYFQAYVYGDRITASKPDPEIFLRAANQLALRPEECCILEDSPNGLLAGLRAGGKVIAVPDLSPIPDELKEKVEVIANNLEEAIPWFDRWNQKEA